MFEPERDPSPVPLYLLQVDGENITATVQGRLIDLTLTDNQGMEADQLDITLDDSDGRLALPPRGAEIALSLGWADEGLVDKGRYVVDEVQHSGAPDRMTIRARSADLRAGVSTQRERSWHDTTVSEIVASVAAAAGLTPVIDARLGAEPIDHLDQTNESDANLLTRVARMFDAVATIKAGRLLFMPLGSARSASGRPLDTVLIERASGDSHSFSLADRESYTHVKALYNDLRLGRKGEVIWSADDDTAETSGKRLPKPDDAPQETAAQQQKPWYRLTTVQPMRSRAARVARKEWKKRSKSKAWKDQYRGVSVPYKDSIFGLEGYETYSETNFQKAKRTASRRAKKQEALMRAPDTTSPAEKEPSVALSGSAENIKTLRHVYASQTNAARAARAEWRRLKRGMAEFRITLARGRPELFPGLPATVAGYKAEIDNTDWLITRVTHSLGDGGYTTALELEIKATELPG